MRKQYDGHGFAWRRSGGGGDAPSAWDYARVAGDGYINVALVLLLLAIWLVVGLALPDSGALTSLIVAVVLLTVGTLVLLLVPVILALATALAWLVGRGMTRGERQQCIDIHRAADAAHVRALLERPTARTSSGNNGLLLAFIAGALLGALWGDDD